MVRKGLTFRELDLGKGSEKVDGIALLVRVGNELGVEFLVPLQADSTGLLVFITKKVIVSIVNLLNVSIGSSADAVQSVFVDPDEAVSVNINSLEVISDEALESRGEFSVGLSRAVLLDGLLELLNAYLTVLVEVSQSCDFVPEVGHDLLVLGVVLVAEVATALDEAVAEGEALEVVLVQVAIVVNVVHEPDDELDAVIPGVSHFLCLVD